MEREVMMGSFNETKYCSHLAITLSPTTQLRMNFLQEYGRGLDGEGGRMKGLTANRQGHRMPYV
jgi:hypothetical protein